MNTRVFVDMPITPNTYAIDFADDAVEARNIAAWNPR